MAVSTDTPSYAQQLQSKKKIVEAITIIVLAIIALFILPNTLSAFRLNLLGRWCAFAIAALSHRLDLGVHWHAQFGACGLLCLGGLLLGHAP